MKNTIIAAKKIYDDLAGMPKEVFTIENIEKYFEETPGINQFVKEIVLQRIDLHQTCVEECIAESEETGETLEYPILLRIRDNGYRSLDCDCCYNVILDEEAAELMDIKTLNIVNGEGDYVNVDIEKIDEFTAILSKPEENYCLTCGTYFSKDEKVEINTVINLEGMKDWLSDRSHYLKLEDNFIICEDCFDEYDHRNEPGFEKCEECDRFMDECCCDEDCDDCCELLEDCMCDDMKE